MVDGDTLNAAYPNGTRITLRLLGWTLPPDTAAGRNCLREEGQDASDFMKQQVLGKEITIEFDDRADRRGRYGRLLVYVQLNDRNINHVLVRRGYARVYDNEFTLSSQFYQSERMAQEQTRGLWVCRDVTETTETATESVSGGTIVVDRIHADAAGNDHNNLNDEYIVFKNPGDQTVEMGGWTVSDEADHRYSVPKGFSLEPGATVTLYTGRGSNTESELYWGSGSAIWNNGGDTITLKNDAGEVVLRKEYT